jgi:hypothetical protein
MERWVGLVADCAMRMRRLPAGDPGVAGWAVTLGYALAAALALVVAARGGGGGGVRDRVFWAGAGLFLAFLAANKQLDLQIWVTATGRCVARAEGWYRDRRAVQATFVVVLAATLALLAVVLAVWLRHSLRRNALALAGIVVLAGFILQRAVSFHHLDAALRTELFGQRAHRWVEMAGIALMLAAAMLALRRRQR